MKIGQSLDGVIVGLDGFKAGLDIDFTQGVFEVSLCHLLLY
jgi:hypothetical protein